MSSDRRKGDPHGKSGISDEALRRELEEIVAEYPEKRAGALMCLHRAQRHRGSLSLASQVLVGEVIGSSPAHVRELVSFYTLFLEESPGRYHLQLCRTLSCQLRGARDLKDRIRRRLSIGPGGVTEDGLFQLTEVECLGSCDSAPVIQINDDYFEGLDGDMLDKLLDELSARPPAAGGQG
ncbi:MAG: NAD(P)H-dependent oxidoreductase subunit E [Acidobacteria bacterium]|nr:NAD(P)H-dependent oxidoreductase subunit E [Acidobacteriota bacterium]